MKSNKLKKVFTSIFFILTFKIYIFALGISTDFNNIYIENLKIGSEYNLTKISNFPVRVKNDSDDVVKIIVKPVFPQEGRVKEGFEIIPSTSWITFSKTELEVGSQEYAVTDLIISIPDDENLLGKKYQVNIGAYITEVKSKSGFLTIMPGIEGRFFFSIAPVKIKEKIDSVDLSFEAVPKEIFSVLKSSFQFIGNVEIKNFSKKMCKYEIKQVSVDEGGMSLKEGYEKLPSGFKIIITKQKFKIKKGKSATFGVYVELKSDISGNYSGKKFMSVIEVKTLGKGVTGQRFVKLFLEID